MKRLLITGSREWDNEGRMFDTLIDARDLLGSDTMLVHGGAAGADRMAGDIWLSMALPVEVHPAQWELLGKSAGPIRNQKMVDLGADLCIAFKKLGAGNRGTSHCQSRALAAGIESWEVWDGD